ncbi:hypothetical protein NVP1257O_26 [Vibrio phage 1.257.O._10N.286.46.A4]|nr:hypothetical protein NVP1257O_26 [Vibrio phage 1.257.O._10N.286.46.A4]
MKKVLLCNAYVTTKEDPNHTIPRGSIVDVVELGKPDSDSLVSHPDCKGFHVWNRDLESIGDFYNLSAQEIELYQTEILYKKAMDIGWRRYMPKEKALALLVDALFEIKCERDKRELERTMYAPSIPVINMEARAIEAVRAMGVTGCMIGNEKPITATEIKLRVDGWRGGKKA